MKYFAKITSDEIEKLKSPAEIAVWFSIKSFAGNGTCYASERQIADRAHCAQDTVARVKPVLVEIGFIENLGLQKRENGWPTYLLKVNGSRSDSQVKANGDSSDIENVNDSRSDLGPKVNDGAVKVNDSREANIEKKEKVDEIWEYYTRTAVSREQYLPDRKKLIAARLKTFSPEDIKEAIANFCSDPWFSTNKGFDYLFRNDLIMDTFKSKKKKPVDQSEGIPASEFVKSENWIGEKEAK